jgi:hypothetical protein
MNFEQSQTWRELTNDAGNYYCQATESERVAMKQFMHGILTEGVVTVEFEKSDGSPRVMLCTLSETLGAKRVNTSTERAPNPDICVVWDCEQDAWRSFRWDRLKRIEFDVG